MILMRISFILIGFLLVSEAAPCQILAPHKAGDVSIGMPVNDVYVSLGKENVSLVDLYLEATFSPALIFSKNDSKLIVIELECDKVWRLTVFDRNYKTDRGIGVGSTYGELRKQYNISSIDVGEGNVVAYVKELDMSFCLDYKKEIRGELKPDQIDSGVCITKLFVL